MRLRGQVQADPLSDMQVYMYTEREKDILAIYESSARKCDKDSACETKRCMYIMIHINKDMLYMHVYTDDIHDYSNFIIMYYIYL